MPFRCERDDVPMEMPTAQSSKMRRNTDVCVAKILTRMQGPQAFFKQLRPSDSDGGDLLLEAARLYRRRTTAFPPTNAAIIALAKAFAEQGIKDGVQVNTILLGADSADKSKHSTSAIRARSSRRPPTTDLSMGIVPHSPIVNSKLVREA